MKPEPKFTADDLISLFRQDVNDEGKTTVELLAEMGKADTSHSRRELNIRIKACVRAGKIRIGRAVRYDVIGRAQHVPVYVRVDAKTH